MLVYYGCILFEFYFVWEEKETAVVLALHTGYCVGPFLNNPWSCNQFGLKVCLYSSLYIFFFCDGTLAIFDDMTHHKHSTKHVERNKFCVVCFCPGYAF